MTNEPRDLLRRRVLGEAGASGGVAEELLAYTANPFDVSRLAGLSLPLADEPHLEAWREYLSDAASAGVFPALAERIVQLRFPVERGISESEAYRAATRRGAKPPGLPGLALREPGTLSLVLHRTAAGHVPILTSRNRHDFVTLVQACSCRNEPDPVPDSMGACIVVGLNNWDRVARYRKRLELERGSALSEGEWAAAFREIVPRKELYQDRFIILSCAPYSGVPAADVGLDETEWIERSIAIRLEHECTHYFTLRAFGTMRNHLLDEFVADFAGLSHAFGRYDAAMFLRFLGLESYPEIRPGGRFWLYIGKPPLSPGAARVAASLVVRAAHRLAAFTAGVDLRPASARAALVAALAALTLEELASEECPAFLASRMPAADRLDARGTIG